MITFEKQENGVLFTFENSDKYLYGDGTILVPFNSLAVIQDTSDMITLRKSASWDIFLSGRYDTDFNYGSKEDAVDALKEALFDETGGGVTEEEVEQMIEEATSGIPSSQVIEQLRTDVIAVSGDVSTLQDDVASKADASALTAVNDALTAHTANTSIHVTSADKSAWDAKQDALTAGENITISGNVISAENNIIELTQEEYDALTEKDPDALYIITDAQEINMNNYATKTDLDAKADASALTAVSDAVTGKADASAVTAVANDVQTVSGQVATKVETSDFNAFSAATDARIATDEEVTAAALNDLAETVSGKQDTLISGENIKTINNISILGEGNITISGGGGGGDYQYYSEDTTNESAAIEVEHQSLTVDGNGVYVNGDPVVTEGALREYVTAEDLEDNYYTQQTIDEKEEVIASALTELNLRVTEDEEVTAAALNDLDENKADTSAVTAVQQSLSGKQDTLVLYTEETVEDYETGSYNKTGKIEATSENGNYVADVYATLEYDGDIGESIPFATMDANTGDGLGSSTMTSVYVDGASATLYAQEDTDDGEGNTGFTSANISVNTMEIDMNVNDGTDEMQVRIDTTGVTINGDAIATEPYVDAAISGKADTSAVTAEISAATSGKVDTSAITTSITSGSTDSEIPSAKATYDAIQAGGGGGATYSAGTNISIANDTISCTLNARNGGNGGLIIGSSNTGGDGQYTLTVGNACSGNRNYSLVVGDQCGVDSTTSQAMGRNVVALNQMEFGCGRYNNSQKANTTFGNNGNTLLSVGNGHYQNGEHKHNALEIRQNGDIYFPDTDNTTYSNYYEKPMVRLQDMYGALGGLKLVKLTQNEYDALATKDSSTLYIISD